MILSIILLLLILWDAFEAIVLPRRVTRRFRFTRFFYRSTWLPWSWIAKQMPPGKWRDGFLSVYGPLSLLFLLIIFVEAIGIIIFLTFFIIFEVLIKCITVIKFS